MKHTRPEDLFRAEKERALTVRNSQHARLLAEAKAAFDKLMAEGQAARKSGRPRKHPLPPLKTSSSTARPPMKPAAPVPPPKPVAPVKSAPVKTAAKVAVRPAAKKAAPARASAKREGKVVKSGAKKAQSKKKSKR
jgi:hypothetical protein